MLNRILAVADNGWIELEKKGALYVLLAAILLGFSGPAYIEYRWVMAVAGHRQDVAYVATILWLDKVVVFIGLCTSILFAAGSIESEISARTLSSVMTHPINRREYLAGRAFSVLFLFFLFSIAALVCGYGAALLSGTWMPHTFLWGLIQRFCAGVTWILIALSLGSILSPGSAIALLITAMVMSFFAPHLPNEIHWSILLFKKIVYYATPSTWPVDFWNGNVNRGGPDRSLLINASIWLENLMYAAVVFLGCSWIFSKKDLKLRT